MGEGIVLRCSPAGVLDDGYNLMKDKNRSSARMSARVAFEYI